MIKSEYKFLYVYDSSFLVDLSYSYAIFSIKSRPLNINIQRKFFFKIRMSNVTACEMEYVPIILANATREAERTRAFIAVTRAFIGGGGGGGKYPLISVLPNELLFKSVIIRVSSKAF